MSSAPHIAPTCAWVGVTGDGEHEVPCGRAADFVIVEPSGHRWYSCEEHLSELEGRSHEGRVFRHPLLLDRDGKPRISPESAVHWE